jgi:sulfoxide reductase heme-binding subunit YedZ
MIVPWRDRRGNFLRLKAAVLAAAFVPGLVLSYWWATGQLGGRPVTEVIHGTGLWAIRFLLISLAISPSRAVFDTSRLLQLRRMLGLTALAYAVAHFMLYIVDQNFHLLTVASEIVSRFYLTIGFVVLLGLIALGVTSTNGMMQRMGRWWKRLHRLIYGLGVLALLHYFIQTKANVTEAVMFTGFFVWLLLWRVLPARWQRSVVAYGAISVVAAVATAWIEFAWYALATGINPWRVLWANEAIARGLRPAHWVLVVGLGVTLLALTARARAKLAGPGRGGVTRVSVPRAG